MTDLDVLAESSPAPMTPIMYRVAKRIQELSDTVTLTLEPQGERVDTPLQGQFMMLWAFGIGEAPISIASIGADGSLDHTIRAVGAVTTALTELDVGDEVGVRGPYGSAWPTAENHHPLVIVGGLGLAPVRPIIEAVLASETATATLLVGSRSPDALLYPELLDAWGAHDRVDVGVIVDHADNTWRGPVGLVTQLVPEAKFDASSTRAYVCGPEPMMRFGAEAAVDRGVPASEVYLSLERNMHCAVVHCGHCQLGPLFICHDGPVLAWPDIKDLMGVRER